MTIQMKRKKLLIIYRGYLIRCLSYEIDNKIDNPPVSYKVFKKELKKMKKDGIINKT